MEYLNLKRTLAGSASLIPINDFNVNDIKDNNTDWYMSLFKYNDQHKKYFDENKSIRGINDTVTNYLFFDFDNKDNIEESLSDAAKLVNKLLNNGIKENEIEICFSGFKGISISLKFERNFTPNEFKQITFGLAEGLPTFDKRVHDPNRIIRVPNTRHPESKLYKIQLSLDELYDITIDSLKKLAVTPRTYNVRNVIKECPKAFLNIKPELKLVSNEEEEEINWANKPKWLSNCKYAIMNGHFMPGRRNDSLTTLAATLRGQGLNKDNAYSILKSASRLQSKRFNQDSKDKEEIWKIVTSVYSPFWNGGTYTCKKPGFLKDLCDTLGEHSCSNDSTKDGLISINSVRDKFINFVQNVDGNTVKTGIPELDDNLRMIAGQNIGILGAPSSGKSSLVLQLLENTSKNNVKSIFFSMDMSDIVTYLKLSSRVTVKDTETVINMVKKDTKNCANMFDDLSERYKNVKLCFRNGLSIENIREMIIDEQKNSDNQLKLVVIDYSSRIAGPWSDNNANGTYIASGLRSIANELGVCVITLLQPPKSAGDARDELTSMRQIKGSSAFEESFDTILSLYRPGFDSNTNSENDKYLVMPVLKNRLGTLFTLKFRWDGLTGSISGLTSDEDEANIDRLVSQNRNKKSEPSDGWG